MGFPPFRQLLHTIAVVFAIADGVKSVYEAEGQHVLDNVQHPGPVLSPDSPSHLPSQALKTETPSFTGRTKSFPEDHPLCDLHSALATMQDQYFDIGLAKWGTSIDWTAAVMNTHMVGILSSMSLSLNSAPSATNDYVNNEISRYFAQNTAFFYGENAFEIRMQAYDDILWVVLEWLDSIKFIEAHSTEHYAEAGSKNSDWHGKQFIPAFAHRARVFYELAEQGWDWRLCGGGMTWNPRLLPYKNAITNQLFISASINIYLHFPGDNNNSPFIPADSDAGDRDERSKNTEDRYNLVYRENAINGYDWLKGSGMLNDQGLYADGFHIHGYPRNKSATTCDSRNEMVYTYNQGVILSGLRGLWEATGDETYLEDGYDLVENVIKATGWNLSRQREADDRHKKWHSLGSAGILTELCDPSASCNQDGQAFKGIFFHHLTAFCERLPLSAVKPGKTHGAPTPLANRHKGHCDSYTSWVVHNAQAALKTRDHDGQFGSWWGSAAHKSTRGENALIVQLPADAHDYRNFPRLLPSSMHPETRSFDLPSAFKEKMTHESWAYPNAGPVPSGDLNDRGRGRTLETQGSGVAVVRAMSEFLRRREQNV